MTDARKAIDELVRCKVHRRYQVKRKPRSTCEACWELWVLTKYFRAQRYGYRVTAVSSIDRPHDNMRETTLTIRHQRAGAPKFFEVYRSDENSGGTAKSSTPKLTGYNPSTHDDFEIQGVYAKRK